MTDANHEGEAMIPGTNWRLGKEMSQPGALS